MGNNTCRKIQGLKVAGSNSVTSTTSRGSRKVFGSYFLRKSAVFSAFSRNGCATLRKGKRQGHYVHHFMLIYLVVSSLFLENGRNEKYDKIT